MNLEELTTVVGPDRQEGSGTPAASSGVAAAKSAGKAGRNLPAAIGVGGSLGIGLILVLVFVPLVWIGVVAVALAVATYEVSKRLREGGVLVPRIPLILGGQAMIWLGWPFGAVGVLSAAVGTVVVCMVWLLLRQGFGTAPKNYLEELSVTVLVACWLPLLASFAVLMVLQDNGAGRILVFVIGVVCSDVGGYIAGVLFGKHPMAPAISPKKSWEGLVGSLIFCVIGCLLTVTLILEANSMIGVLLGVVLVVTGTLGDLIESQVKRDLRIKDMGSLLPGHGGIMDRLDSLLPSAFVAWLVFTVLL
ncbi:phosphatidate cytidylyltransferase [Rhodococcus ruber]|uniref:Phosphatidate cytidylyltransferase n=1 Tax=Rhodococcus ruber TaxID=1830 RepID=A0ABT4MCK2_9NOCA|nr:phosphatidate cytidylyltransferase [Rhodococcus ruber]MCZ4518583.1 phosphatidate cytidylyltransferase [Rhodococcus ruber]